MIHGYRLKDWVEQLFARAAGTLTTLVLATTVAQSATERFVTNLNDSGGGSLRQAILALNAAGGGDIWLSATGTIALASALPSFTANIRVFGTGTNAITISGQNRVSVFTMESGTTNVLSGLTIANGFAEGDFSEFDYTFASGINNSGTLRIVECLIRNCTNNISYGVGIYNAGELVMDNCQVLECGAGIGFNGQFGVLGGGLYNTGTAELNACRIESGRAGRGAGIYNRGEMNASDCVLSSCAGGPEQDGGGLYNVATASLNGCTISNCVAFFGGAAMSSGSLSLTNSSILQNRSDSIGGGLALLGTTVLEACTLARNEGGLGGGIANGGPLQLVNCTISGNASRGFGSGGVDDRCSGFPAGTVNFNHCTVVSNSGFGEIDAGVACFAANSILGDCSGALTSGGHNLIIVTNDAIFSGQTETDMYGADPNLGPLQDNGGSTFTHALLAGSPAIDRGSNGGLLTDQRGFDRAFDLPDYPNAGDGSDIGAFELLSPNPWISPVLAGRISGLSAETLAVSATKLYVGAGPGGLRSFEISEPSHPILVGQVSDGGSAVKIELNGKDLFVANSRDGVRIYDTSRAQFISKGHVNTAGAATAVAVTANLALVADDAVGLGLYQVSNRKELKLASKSGLGATATDIVIRKHHAFVAAGNRGVFVYQMQNRNRLRLLSRITGAVPASAVAINGDYLYVASRENGIIIFDVSDTANPGRLRQVATVGSASDIAIRGDLAYLANGNDGLRIYDISVPARPVLLARATECQGAKAVTVAGRYAFVAAGAAGVFIYYTGGPNPRLDLAKEKNGASLVIHGLPGDQFRILSSSDLVHWETMQSLTNTTGRLEIKDAGATGPGARFYRTVMP